MPTESALLCSISRFIINVDDCNISSSIITNLTAFSGLQFYKKLKTIVLLTNHLLSTTLVNNNHLTQRQQNIFAATHNGEFI